MTASVFVDKFDSDECSEGGTHDFNKESILTYLTRKGEERYISEDHYLKGRKKQYSRMKIIGGQCRCCKCKIPYMIAHNPNFI